MAAFKTLAKTVAADGVTLNTVLPGRIGTDRLFGNAGSREEAEAAARDAVPAARRRHGGGARRRGGVPLLRAGLLHHGHHAARRRRAQRVGLTGRD